MTDTLNFLLHFGFNLLVAVLLVRLIYYPATRDKRYVFTIHIRRAASLPSIVL